MALGGKAVGEVPPKKAYRNQGNQGPMRVIGDMAPVTGEPDIATQSRTMLCLNGLHTIRIINQAQQNYSKGNLYPIDGTGGESDSGN